MSEHWIRPREGRAERRSSYQIVPSFGFLPKHAQCADRAWHANVSSMSFGASVPTRGRT